jgi:hypothetical protein
MHADHMGNKVKVNSQIASAAFIGVYLRLNLPWDF